MRFSTCWVASARSFAEGAGLDPEDRRAFRTTLRQVAKTRRKVLAAKSEARVHLKVENVFGRPRVRLFESFIMVLIAALLGLVFFEWRLPIDGPAWLGAADGSLSRSLYVQLVVETSIQFFNIVDLVYCVFFQIDFFVRWAFAGWGIRYFLRHFFFESLPALPYGFIFHQMGAFDEARAVILVRILRLRGAMTLRALLLVSLRLFRVAVFFVRGVDRAVEKFRSVLDRDIVLFETDPLGESPESPIRRRAIALETRRQRLQKTLYTDTQWAQRAGLLSIHGSALGVETRVSSRVSLPYRRGLSQMRGEIRIEQVIYNFLDCDVTRAISMIGRDGVERVARWIRFIDVPGFRNAPILRRLAPAARMLHPAEAVSFAVNAIGQVLQEFLGAMRFWADLSGITTGPQILDRVGTAIITASKRPAIRLILFGSLFLLVQGFIDLLGFEVLKGVAEKLSAILGVPILLLGSVCLVFLLAGSWFKRISGEALDQYLRTSDAQFYPLIKARKFLRFEDDIRFLYRAVLRPEARLRGAGDTTREEWCDFLSEPLRERAKFMPGRSAIHDERLEPFAEDREALVMLYRDFLDSPVLHRTDDNASVQLLGNLSLRSIRKETLGLEAKALKKLERLSLERGSILTLGPYFWFRFITESLSIETAKLIVEYNTCCIPKGQLILASEESRAQFERFLAERSSRRPSIDAGEEKDNVELATASFTAFDFLEPD